MKEKLWELISKEELDVNSVDSLSMNDVEEIEVLFESYFVQMGDFVDLQ